MKITKRLIKKIVQEELEKQKKLKEENSVAANPGMTYNTPRFVSKKRYER